MPEMHDTVIVGGGQSGLAMSYHLRQRGREHVILERRGVAERWRTERWDSLRLLELRVGNVGKAHSPHLLMLLPPRFTGHLRLS
jgi:glycine/D-amino acid oxidase-like deaminating enzyme